MHRRTAEKSRRGSVIVEMALVAPLIFLMVFSVIEFGRAIMVLHGLDEAAREGCRTAVLKGATTNDVINTVTNRLATFGIAGAGVAVTPNPPSNANQWDPVRVDITVPYENVSWLPTANFLKGKMLSVSCTLPRESDK